MQLTVYIFRLNALSTKLIRNFAGPPLNKLILDCLTVQNWQVLLINLQVNIPSVIRCITGTSHISCANIQQSFSDQKKSGTTILPI